MIKFKYGCGIMIGNSWDDVLKEEIHKDYFKKLVKFLNEESKCKEIYPKSVNLFRALKLTDYKDVNVVILVRIHIMVRMRRMDCVFLLIMV